MLRKASLHILEENLVKVLQEVVKENDDLSSLSLADLAKTICRKGKKYALLTRKILEDSPKAAPQLAKTALSVRKDALAFSHTLSMCRRKAKHRGIGIIKEGSRDWLLIKEITYLANQFCEDFGINSKETGYVIYINIALEKMQKFGLPKFNSMHESICRTYEAQVDIKHDNDSEGTKRICDAYNRLLSDYSAYPQNWHKHPEKYMNFIRVREICRKEKIEPKEYLTAQFVGLQWANTVPDPLQLIGDKALERWFKYAVKNKIKTPEPKAMEIDFSKILSNGKNHNK